MAMFAVETGTRCIAYCYTYRAAAAAAVSIELMLVRKKLCRGPKHWCCHPEQYKSQRGANLSIDEKNSPFARYH